MPTVIRAPDWETHIIETWDSITLYAIDPINPVAHQQDATLRENERRCSAFKQLFDEHGDPEICNAKVITIYPAENQQDWDSYWFGDNGQLNGKTDRDLVIITYAGEAYGERQNYMW